MRTTQILLPESMNSDKGKVNNCKGYAPTDENLGEITFRTVKCNVCDFKKIDKGGMKRHIKSKYIVSEKAIAMDENTIKLGLKSIESLRKDQKMIANKVLELDKAFKTSMESIKTRIVDKSTVIEENVI